MEAGDKLGLAPGEHGEPHDALDVAREAEVPDENGIVTPSCTRAS